MKRSRRYNQAANVVILLTVLYGLWFAFASPEHNLPAMTLHVLGFMGLMFLGLWLKFSRRLHVTTP